MKRSNLITSMIVASALSLGAAGQVAGQIERVPEASRTTLGSQAIPTVGVDRYRFDIEKTTTVRIDSRGLGGGASEQLIRLDARLLDANGNVMAQARPSRGHFSLTETLEPGTYVVEVRGAVFGGTREGSSGRYSLDLDER